MLARERLTGLKPPAGAERLTDLWRGFVEEKAGADLDKLSNAILDQRAYAKLMQKLLTSLGLANDAEADARREAGRRRDPASGGAGQCGRRGRGEPVARTRCSARPPTIRPTTPTRGRWTRSRRRRPSSTTRARRATPRKRPRTGPRRRTRSSAARSTTRPTRPNSTRSSAPTNCATPTNCSGCGTISTSNCRTCRRSWRGSPTGCSAA